MTSPTEPVRAWIAVVLVAATPAAACAARRDDPTPPTERDEAATADAATDAAPDAVRVEARPPASCLSRGTAACNPVTHEGCFEDEACDFVGPVADLALACERVPDVSGRASAGEPCAGSASCVPGHRCQKGVCRAWCCRDADCTGPGEECLALGPKAGTLGTCGVPACAPAGGACQADKDCCSADCHGDHCH